MHEILKQCWVCDIKTAISEEFRKTLTAALERYYVGHSLIYKENRSVYTCLNYLSELSTS